MPSTIEVVDRGRRITFSFEDVLKYHGPGSPGGAAHAFKVLERALPVLDPRAPCERREIHVDTAFEAPARATPSRWSRAPLPASDFASTLRWPGRSAAERWSASSSDSATAAGARRLRFARGS